MGRKRHEKRGGRIGTYLSSLFMMCIPNSSWPILRFIRVLNSYIKLDYFEGGPNMKYASPKGQRTGGLSQKEFYSIGSSCQCERRSSE